MQTNILVAGAKPRSQPDLVRSKGHLPVHEFSPRAEEARGGPAVEPRGAEEGFRRDAMGLERASSRFDKVVIYNFDRTCFLMGGVEIQHFYWLESRHFFLFTGGRSLHYMLRISSSGS